MNNERFIEAAQNAETSIRLAELLHLADQRIASLEAERDRASTPSQTVLAGLGESLWKAEEHIRTLAERIASLEAERDRAYTSFQFKLNNKREECEGLREHVAYLKAKLVECHAELAAIKADRAAAQSAKACESKT